MVEVPAFFDDRAFDQFAAALGDWPPEERILIDARQAQWASPYGLTALVTAGQALLEAGRERPLFTVPAQDEVSRYWAKAGFFRYAPEYFEMHGKVPKTRPDDSDVLLGVTPIRAAEDVHEVVGRLQEGATRILQGELGIEARATAGFAMALSESCQNIVEHAGTGGWAAVHAYTFRRRLGGRRVAVIAVSDAGIGFRRSLEATQLKRFGERWGDAAALEAALIHNTSRFRDPGRGQGLAGTKRYLARWEGKIGIRSGTARLSIVPAWDDDVPLASGLPFFPGAQLQITIPAQDQAR